MQNGPGQIESAAAGGFERTKPSNFAASASRRACFHWLSSRPSDCRYPYGGDKEGEAITFWAIRGSPARAIARRIFI